MASSKGLARLSTRLGGVVPTDEYEPALGDNLNPEVFVQISGTGGNPPGPSQAPNISRIGGYFLKTVTPAIGSIVVPDVSTDIVDGDWFRLPDGLCAGGWNDFEFKMTPGHIPTPGRIVINLSGGGGWGPAIGIIANALFNPPSMLHLWSTVVVPPVLTFEYAAHFTGSAGNQVGENHVASPNFVLNDMVGGGLTNAVFINIDDGTNWLEVSRLATVLVDMYGSTYSIGHVFLPAPSELANNDYVAVPGCGAYRPQSPRTFLFEFHVSDPFTLSTGAIEVDIRSCVTKEDVRDVFRTQVQAFSCLIEEGSNSQTLTASSTWHYPLNGNWTRCAFYVYSAASVNLACDGLSGGIDALSLCLDQFNDIRTLLELLPNLVTLGEDAHTDSLDWLHHHILAMESLQGNLATLTAVAAAWDLGGRFLPPP